LLVEGLGTPLRFAARTKKPGAVPRPGALRQFQFRE
jgi:hypothetical protein